MSDSHETLIAFYVAGAALTLEAELAKFYTFQDNSHTF